MSISVIIPVYNYEVGVEDTVESIRQKAKVDEILLMWDVTKPELKNKILGFSEKLKKKYKAKTYFRFNQKGFGSAIRLGFEKAKGDSVVVMMGDLCDDPATIPLMEKEMGKGFDIVSGCRYCKGGGIIGNTFKQKISSMVSLVINVFSKVKCRDLTNAFKMYRKEVVKTVGVKTKSGWFDISIELPLKAARKGYKISQVPTVWKNRDVGKSNFNFLGESKRYLKWFLYAAFTMPSLATKTLSVLILLLVIFRLFF